jgi:FG-GAP-like repeat
MLAQPTKKHIKCLVLAAIIAGGSAALLESTRATPDALDKTNCEGVVLDDSPFAEPVVRDHRDQSYGALSNPTMRPLGGGEGYNKIVPRPATVVRTGDELRAALLAAARAPQTIYVADDAEIDLSYCAKTPRPRDCRFLVDPALMESRSRPTEGCSDYSLAVPANTTLASGRGRGGSRGARLFTRTFSECPLLDVKGEGVRITGLRIHGPDSSIENDDPIHCGGEAVAIGIRSDGPQRWATEIDNNDLSSWPRAAVEIDGVQGVRVHHNVIQFNRRHEHNNTCGSHNYGLGYGVVIGPGSVTIEANVFDHNRHDIASDGRPGAHYTATYNLVLAGAVQHSFDVHGGEDRGDCTNIAGSAFVIHHNTFLQSHKPAVRMRGIPMTGAWIYKNETRDDEIGDAFNQINSHGKFTVDDNLTSINRFPAWFISFGGTSFWQWQHFEGTAMSDVRAGDFDGGGAAEVIRTASTGWQWSKSAREAWAFLNTLTDPISQLGFGDFVGLAFTDVIRATGSEWQVSEGGTSPWRSLYRTTAPLSSAAFGDFEGDDHTDAFFADGTQWSIVQSFSPRVTRHYAQPYKLTELRFGNFVGDSKVDALRSIGHDWLVWDRVSQTWDHLGGFPAISLSQLVFADFDGDGFTDIARSANGQWLVSWGGKSAWSVLNTSDQDLRSLVIADFNGDHKADVLSRQSPDP